MPRQRPSASTSSTTPSKTPRAGEGDKPPSTPLPSKSPAGSARKKAEKPKLALSAKKSLDPLHAAVRAAFTDAETTRLGSKSKTQIREWIEANYSVDTVLLGEFLPKSIRTLMKKQILAAVEEEGGSHPGPSEIRYCVVDKSPPGHGDGEGGGEEAGPSTSAYRPALTLKLARVNAPAARSKSQHEKAGGSGVSGVSAREGRRMAKRKSEMVAPSLPVPAPRSELRALQDSLSAFFTPTDPRIRRSRLEAQTAIAISNLQPDSSALSVVVDEAHQPAKIKAKHGPISSSTVESMASSGDTSHSPHRHKAKASAAEQLQDALSPYFSASTERRRKHEAGEYLQMSQHGLTPLPPPPGRGKRGEGDSIAGSLDDKREQASSSSHHRRAESDLQSARQNSELGQQAMSSPPRLKRQTTRTSRATQKAAVVQQVPPDLPIRQRKAASVAALKSASLVRRARQQQGAVAASRGQRKGRSVGGSATRTSSSALISSYFQPVRKGRAANNSSPPPHLSPQKAPPLSPPLGSAQNYKSTQWDIPDEDVAMFNKAREVVQQELYVNSKKMMKSKATTSGSNEASQQPIYPPRIQIGRYRIDTWYSAPYPQEYASLPLLHVCEDCLMYLAVPESHAQKCRVLNPPGNEIYRQGDLSVWEVDGNLARVYCRNLCLLAKLFIDHKTLYFDVEPFLFYVLTQNDERGYHFVGYFSKEKYSQQKFMLACIVTLPCYHRHGYGRFLIDFSYLLARREGAIGTPERPLSDLGRIAYASYWRTALYEELYQRCVEDKAKALSLADLSEATGIAVHDVVEALTQNNLLVATPDNTVSLRINEKELERHWTKAHANPRRIWIDESKLQWEPKLYTPTKEHLGGIRSPTFSPVPHRRVQAAPPATRASTPPPAGEKKRGRKTGGGKKTTATPRRKLSLDGDADQPSTSRQAATASIPEPTKLKRKRGRPPKAKPDHESLVEDSPKPDEGPKRRSQKSPAKPASTSSGCKPPEKKGKKPPESSDDEDEAGGDRPARTRARRAASRGPTRGSAGTEKAAQSKSGRAQRDSGKCTVMQGNRRPSKKPKSNTMPIVDPAQLSVAVNSLHDSSSHRIKSKTTFLSSSSSSSSSSASSDEESSPTAIALPNPDPDPETLKEMERVRDLESGSASGSEDSTLFRPRTRSQYRRIGSIQSAEAKAALRRSSVSSDDITSEVAKKTPKHKSTPKTPKSVTTMAATAKKTPQSSTARGKSRLLRRRGLRPRPMASSSLSSSTHSRSTSKDPSASGRGAESDDEADEDDEGDIGSDLVDSSYCCSSVSPPARERGTLRRSRFTSTSTGAANANESMINMGGEPNTVNMGGEPPPTPKSGAINTRQRPPSLEDYDSPKAPQGLLAMSQPSRLAAVGVDGQDEGETAPLLVANGRTEWAECEGNDDGESGAMPELGSPNRLTVEDVFGEEGEENGSEAEAKEAEDDTPPHLSPNPIENHAPPVVSDPESPPLQSLNVELGLDRNKGVRGGAKTSKRREGERTKHRKPPARAEPKEKKTQPREPKMPKTPRRRKSVEARKSSTTTTLSEKVPVSSAAPAPLQGEYCLSLLGSEGASLSATAAASHHQPLQRQESAPFVSPPPQLSSIVGSEPAMHQGEGRFEQAHPPVLAQLAPSANVVLQPSSQAAVNAAMQSVEQPMGPGQVAVASQFHHHHTQSAVVEEHHYQMHQGQPLDDLAGLSVPPQPQSQQLMLTGQGQALPLPPPPPNAYPQLAPLYHHHTPPPPPPLQALQQASIETPGSIVKPIPHFPMIDSTPSSTASYSSLNHHARPSPTKPAKSKTGGGGKKGHKPKPPKGPLSSLAMTGQMTGASIPPGMDSLAAAAYYQQYQAALVAHQAQSMMNGQYATPGLATGGGGYGHYGGDMSSAMANYGNSISMYGLGSQQQHQHQSSQQSTGAQQQPYPGAYNWPAYYGFAAGQQCYGQGTFGPAHWPGGTPTAGMEQQAAMAAAAAAAAFNGTIGGGASAFPTATASGHHAYHQTPTSAAAAAVYQGVYGVGGNPYLTNS